MQVYYGDDYLYYRYRYQQLRIKGRYDLRVITQPTPVSSWVDECKQEIRFFPDSEATLLAGKINAARLAFEKLTNGCVVLPTVFRQSVSHLVGPLDLMAGNISAVGSVNYYSPQPADAITQLASGGFDGWTADIGMVPTPVYVQSTVYPAYNIYREWPAYVDFTAGWNPDQVPDLVRKTILGYAAWMYMNRESTDKVMPIGFVDSCSMFDTGLVGGWRN